MTEHWQHQADNRAQEWAAGGGLPSAHGRNYEEPSAYTTHDSGYRPVDNWDGRAPTYLSQGYHPEPYSRPPAHGYTESQYPPTHSSEPTFIDRTVDRVAARAPEFTAAIDTGLVEDQQTGRVYYQNPDGSTESLKKGAGRRFRGYLGGVASRVAGVVTAKNDTAPASTDWEPATETPQSDQYPPTQWGANGHSSMANHNPHDLRSRGQYDPSPSAYAPPQQPPGGYGNPSGDNPYFPRI